MPVALLCACRRSPISMITRSIVSTAMLVAALARAQCDFRTMHAPTTGSYVASIFQAHESVVTLAVRHFPNHHYSYMHKTGKT